ncbi:hypothetical protein ACIRRI_06890 [Streptomyces mirabilis]|uniref:hypothetical protein n=1 Tax=Streptomyces mirabilis TaxID=68239 RepID=UPI0037F5FC76
MSELDHWWDRFTVASQALVGAWTDLRVREYDKEPHITAAALEDVEQMIRELREAGLGQGDTAEGRPELIETALEYGNHTCTCPYCVHARFPGETPDLLRTEAAP